MLRAFALSLLVALAARCARADAVLFIEEPINFLGHLSSTGHAALMLDHLCSDDHLHIRPCGPAEPGTVISRYQGIGRHDWLAMPPAAYLYSADDDNHLPALATRESVDLLREQYRALHLQLLAPDPADERWIQLVGTAYRRRAYAIRVHTTPAQDARLMKWLNRRANQSHFNFFFNNCADFMRQALNVLYPGAIRRSFIFDAGMTTPKQLASRLHRYADRHPELNFQVSVVPQIPGELPRSGHLYGVTESFARTKPWLYPLGILQPIGIGTVVAVGFSDRRYDVHSNVDAPVLDLDPPEKPAAEFD